jgi:hypothetical protein
MRGCPILVALFATRVGIDADRENNSVILSEERRSAKDRHLQSKDPLQLGIETVTARNSHHALTGPRADLLRPLSYFTNVNPCGTAHLKV